MLQNSLAQRRAFLKMLAAGAMGGTTLSLVSACDNYLQNPAVAKKLIDGGLYSAPLESVKLLPSPFLTASLTNLSYIKKLDMDRLLARYRSNAGLEPLAENYPGWEADALAGHTLGHYLSAISMLWSQLKDHELLTRAEYIIDQLMECQIQHGDGYVAALGRWTGGKLAVNGKPLFHEIKRGTINVKYGTLNGGWAPFYVLDKEISGLLDVYIHMGYESALSIALGLGKFIENTLSGLTDEELQEVLSCEFGGIQGSLARLAVAANEPTIMVLSRRMNHKAVTVPISKGNDILNNHHSNTEIPKFVSAALIGRIDNDPNATLIGQQAWTMITSSRTYANGGNGDQEWFREKSRLSDYITDQNCEHCSTYNMLKLTRELFIKTPESTYFDYFENAHLNHIMAAQHPKDGGFAYMTPLMAGAKRVWSKVDEDFWCCVGTGMESHAKHAESIFWLDDAKPNQVYVNLFIPAEMSWQGIGKLTMLTDYPVTGNITIGLDCYQPQQTVIMAVRSPAWSSQISATFNGAPVKSKIDKGYMWLELHCRGNDQLNINLDLPVRKETIADNGNFHAFYHGPLLLAADMGKEGPVLPEYQWPALVHNDNEKVKLSALPAVTHYITNANDSLTLKPYNELASNRTSVYFPLFNQSQWKEESLRRRRLTEEERVKQASTIDKVLVGEPVSEEAHKIQEYRTEPTPYRGNYGRRIKPNGYLTYTFSPHIAPLAVYITFWGEATRGHLEVRIDNKIIGQQKLEGNYPGRFFEAEFVIPSTLIQMKSFALTLFTMPETRAPSVYGIRLAPPSNMQHAMT